MIIKVNSFMIINLKCAPVQGYDPHIVQYQQVKKSFQYATPLLYSIVECFSKLSIIKSTNKNNTNV